MCEEGRRHRSLGVWAQSIRRSLQKRTARVSASAMETRELVVLREFQHAAVLYIKRPYWIAEVPPRQALAIRPPDFARPKPIDTPSLKPEERSTLSCPMFERT